MFPRTSWVHCRVDVTISRVGIRHATLGVRRYYMVWSRAMAVHSVEMSPGNKTFFREFETQVYHTISLTQVRLFKPESGPVENGVCVILRVQSSCFRGTTTHWQSSSCHINLVYAGLTVLTYIMKALNERFPYSQPLYPLNPLISYYGSYGWAASLPSEKKKITIVSSSGKLDHRRRYP